MRDGVRAEDLEALTFDDESFDLVVTQDVFEHVLRPGAGVRRDRPGARPRRRPRVLRPPVPPPVTTVVRAAPSPDGGITHLLAPDYHKDPVDPSGALVIREWSTDIADFIHAHSGLVTTIHNLRDRRLGIDGDHRDILVSRKPA